MRASYQSIPAVAALIVVTATASGQGNLLPPTQVKPASIMQGGDGRDPSGDSTFRSDACPATDVGVLASDGSVTITGDNCASGNHYENDGPDCNGYGAGGRDEIYQFTLDQTGVWEFNTTQPCAGWDTSLMVREETGGGCPGVFVACDGDSGNDACGWYESWLQVFLSAGPTYYLVVDGWEEFECGAFQVSPFLAQPACADDADCADGVFCNGAETCNVGTGQCADGAPPCTSYQSCDETGDTCVDPDPCASWLGGSGSPYFFPYASYGFGGAWIADDIELERGCTDEPAVLEYYEVPIIGRDIGGTAVGEPYFVDLALWTVEEVTCMPLAQIPGSQCIGLVGLIAPGGSPPDIFRCAPGPVALPDNSGDFNRCEIDFFVGYVGTDLGIGFHIAGSDQPIGGPGASDDFGVNVYFLEEFPGAGTFFPDWFGDDVNLPADFAEVVVCTDNHGVCCEGLGRCTEGVLESECTGDWIPCVFWDPPVCLGVTACHFPDQTCADMDERCCINEGGTPKPGESCLGVEACCMPDNTCEDIDVLVCGQKGGAPKGPGSVCMGMAACHFPDQTCVDMDANCCLNKSGTPKPGEFCLGVEACCMPDNTCEDIDVLVCGQKGGAPKGPGSMCMGMAACHFPDQTCEDMDQRCCLNQGGTPKPGESCLGVEACCMPDNTCEEIDVLVCLQKNGAPKGQGSVCLGMAACHFPDQTCEDMDGHCCLNMGGTPKLGEHCRGIEACCMSDNTCEEIDALVCLQKGSAPKGPGSVCMGVSACHFLDQTCVDMDAHCCLNKGGTPKPGESCLGVEACRMPDNTCEEIDALVCTQKGGDPQGPGSMCLRLTLAPEEFCVTDPNGQVEVPIVISGIEPDHPITGVTFNVEWDPNSCWQLCDVNDVEPVPPFEQLGEDTGPGYARFTATIPNDLDAITDTQAVAILCFQADLPPDGCCVETLTLTAGPDGWVTIVTGLDIAPLIYTNIPILGPAKEVRLDAVAPIIKECVPDMFAKMDPGVCTWTPASGDIVEPTWNENCEDCDATLTFERSDGVLLPLTAPFTSKKKVSIDWTIEDCCGNSVTCATTVFVEDNQAPVISPPSTKYTVSVDENCVWELPDLQAMPTTAITITDNCDEDPNTVQVPATGTIWGPGHYDVSVNANDSNGNQSSGSYNINVVDTTAPVFTNTPEDIKVFADAGKCTANVSWEIGADDNCNWIKVICDYRSGSDFPLGKTTVICTASDEAGNSATYSFQIVVNRFWLVNVEVGIQGFVSKRGPFDRCVQFQLRDCVDGVLPLQDLNAVLTFDGGVAMATLEIPVGAPCVEGSYSCVRAKATRYSLWSTVEDPNVSLGPEGRKSIAIFTGDDALKLGDLNNSGFVDIEDWARWNHQFLGGFIPPLPPPPPADLCDPKADPTDPLQQHADFNGDGYVTAVDFSHLFTNLAEGDDLACCFVPPLTAASDGPRMRISVAELRTAGMGSVAQYDSNNDGYVDVYEAGLSAPEASPVKPVARPADTRRIGER